MKFTLATALAVLAIPMAATAVAIPEALDLDPAAAHLGARSPADCTIHMKWTDNWGEAGFRRYRVHAWAEQGKLSANTSTMLQMWCATFFDNAMARPHGNHPGVVNPQCWLSGPNEAYADISTFEGSNGHRIYETVHQDAANAWRDWSKKSCDVDSSF